ncbi:MAG: hypothetical protein IKT99_01010, partial [Oscillospiraceae bacterium]|nr:hypothetical protein [Oscillospiraceae bacterium]
MKILREVLRKNRAAILVFAAMTAVNAAVFALYGVCWEPLLYGALLSLVLLAAVLAVDYYSEKRRGAERARTLAAIASEWRQLPEPESL